MEQDIRWQQRFSNFKKALIKLDEAIIYLEIESDDKLLNEILKEGLIQRFEYTHELAWNLMKDYAEYQGNFTVAGSRDASREAFVMGLIINGDVWMDMIKSRNQTSHTYNESTVLEISKKIKSEYQEAFYQLKEKMESLLTH